MRASIWSGSFPCAHRFSRPALRCRSGAGVGPAPPSIATLRVAHASIGDIARTYLDMSRQDELRLVTPFAISRAQSMNSWATGLSVRFFSVITPIGRRVVGKSMGKTLRFVLPGPNLTIEAWTMLRNRPLASRALRTGVDVLKTVA